MPKLWLNFTDQNGDKRRISFDSDRFVIGRHPDNDLTISDTRLSRRHARIERFGDSFTVSDEGSSNGSDVNGEPVFDPVTLKNGDLLNLGGLEIVVEIVLDTPQPNADFMTAQTATVVSDTPKVNQALKPTGIPIGIILAAPFVAIILIALVGGVIYLISTRDSAEIIAAEDADSPAIENEADSPKKDNGNDKSSTPKQKDEPPTPVGTDDSDDTTPSPTPANLSDTAKVEVNAASFLRKIAQNDPRAFLTTDQVKIVSSKAKQFSGSSAIAANIDAARKNAVQIRTLATSKNMKPQFLAVAALVKLGNSRGDVVQAAQSMADVLDKLSIQLGNELADDCLLSIAAFDQGAAGDTQKMRNMLQEIATKFPESSRAIRTIWFLQKQGKVNQSEFDRAISFIAIGAITQNPKDFGVNAEALSL